MWDWPIKTSVVQCCPTLTVVRLSLIDVTKNETIKNKNKKKSSYLTLAGTCCLPGSARRDDDPLVRDLITNITRHNNDHFSFSP